MRKQISVCVVFLAILCHLAGCLPVSHHYKGRLVSQDDIVMLQQGEWKGNNWQTFDVDISFDYVLSGNQLTLSGFGQLGQHYQAIYTHVRSFYMYLFFVDADGIVLEANFIPTHMMYRPDDKFPINKSFLLPPLTAGFTFGYQGNVYERESGETNMIPFVTDIHFSKLPEK